MAKFDYMTFGISPGDRDLFVAHAGKFSDEDTVRLCIAECDDLFTRERDCFGHPRKPLRLPTVDDVQDARCAFRFGMYEFPEGAYTICGTDDEPGSFPVHVIDFDRLRAGKGS